MTITCKPSAPGEVSRVQQMVENSICLDSLRQVGSTHAIGVEWLADPDSVTSWLRSRVEAVTEITQTRVIPQDPAADDFMIALRHYSRRLDRRVLHPMLAAETRDAAHEVLRAQWSWFMNTMTTMITLFADSAGGGEREQLDKDAREQITLGAARAGDSDGREIDFVLSTHVAAQTLAATIEGTAREEFQVDDSVNATRFGAYCNLYGLGVILLRAAVYAPTVTKCGGAVAMELARMGALHAYAHARQAIEFRREPEPEYTPVELDEGNYAPGMSH